MKLIGLSRQLAIAMATVAVGVAVLIVVTSLIFYYYAFSISPEQYPQGWAPTAAEWTWLTATTLAGVALAVIVAGHLAKRILLPLDSLAQAIRSVAKGNLRARAEVGERPLAEAAALVEDFNKLADELQRVTQERTYWNAAIAHELRTPVTVLRGRLQGLAEGVFEPDPTQFSKLLTQVEGLGRLIEDLRAISLAESGHLELRWERADLARDIGEICDSLASQFSNCGQRIFLTVEATRVLCDPIRIRQALLALLDNARRYASPGTIAVRIWVERGRFFLSVEDEGPGIPPEVLNSVFEPFRRAGTPRDSSERASGLGLAVVAAIAHSHGGSASCLPTEKGGTRFVLEWPTEGRIPAAT